MTSTGSGTDGAAVGVPVTPGVAVGLVVGSTTVVGLGLDEPPPLPPPPPLLGEEDTGVATTKLTDVAPSAYVSV